MLSKTVLVDIPTASSTAPHALTSKEVVLANRTCPHIRIGVGSKGCWVLTQGKDIFPLPRKVRVLVGKVGVLRDAQELDLKEPKMFTLAKPFTTEIKVFTIAMMAIFTHNHTKFCRTLKRANVSLPLITRLSTNKIRAPSSAIKTRPKDHVALTKSQGTVLPQRLLSREAVNKRCRAHPRCSIHVRKKSNRKRGHEFFKK